jgi:hypothetical protein
VWLEMEKEKCMMNFAWVSKMKQNVDVKIILKLALKYLLKSRVALYSTHWWVHSRLCILELHNEDFMC